MLGSQKVLLVELRFVLLGVFILASYMIAMGSYRRLIVMLNLALGKLLVVWGNDDL